MTPTFTISVVCFNNLDLTKRCIESIEKHSGNSWELIVTNNNSDDDTPRYLEALKSRMGRRLTVVTNKANLGFQEPNINALQLAKGIYFVLLNNDMEVCPEWLLTLSSPFALNPKLAIVGNAGTCSSIDKNLKATSSDPVEYIEGSLLMIPTAIARKHRLFSPYLQFAYWEDTDLSFRLRELGYDITTVKLPIRHDNRGSTTKMVDVSKFVAHNTAAMKARWSFYFKRRDFRRRVLIKRLGARGDVLLLSPILKAIREKWPQCEIEVKTKCPEMIRGFPGVKTAFHSKSYFDHEFDLNLAYEKRPEVHIIRAYADVLGVEIPRVWTMEMFPTEQEEAWAFNFARGNKIALIHGGVTTWPGKNWPWARMEDVVKWLKAQDFFTISVGASDSPECMCDDSIAGKTTPQALYALSKHARLFVGLDSMPQHIASAANTPSVVLFGPTNPAVITRPSHRIIPVQASRTLADCVGAHGRRTIPVTQAPCDGACIRAITVEMVKRAIERVLILTK